MACSLAVQQALLRPVATLETKYSTFNWGPSRKAAEPHCFSIVLLLGAKLFIIFPLTGCLWQPIEPYRKKYCNWEHSHDHSHQIFILFKNSKAYACDSQLKLK